MDLTGKSVVVTGAGKGIGRATALMLARRGAKVIALTRSAADLQTLEAEIGCRSIAVDLADPDATREAARAALPADFLINCAGTTALEPFLETSVAAFRPALCRQHARADDRGAGICPRPRGA